MIVDPDMPDHWKVQMLAGMLGDDAAAPVYLIRLWGHCQNRKSHVFDSLPPMGIRAICKYPGDPDQLDAALIECGFIARDGKEVTVVGWDEHNANLLNAWHNGSKGGRPKKPTKNPRVSHGNTYEVEEVDKEDKEDEKKGSAKRACRLPEDFPREIEIQWAKANEPAVDAKREAAKFRDYWKGKSGKDATKADWPATWRNWIRKAAEWRKPTGDDARNDAVAAAKAYRRQRNG